MVLAGGDRGTVALAIGAVMYACTRERGGHGLAAATGFRIAEAPDTVRAPDRPLNVPLGALDSPGGGARRSSAPPASTPGGG